MALNPIIEAFLAAREQASRDFAQDQNRVLAREQMSEEAKRQQEQLKNQRDLLNIRLQQEQTIADAQQKLHKLEIDRATRTGDAATMMKFAEGVAGGSIQPPTKTSTQQTLNPDFMQVGQPTTFDTTKTELDEDALVAALGPLLSDPNQARAATKLLPPFGNEYQQKMAVEEAKQKVIGARESDRLASQHEYRLGEIGAQGDIQSAIHFADRESREKMNAARIAAMLQGVRMKSASKGAGNASNLKQLAETEHLQFLTGDATEESLARFTKIADRGGFVQALKDSDTNVLSKAQANAIHGLSPLISTYNKFKNYANAIEKSASKSMFGVAASRIDPDVVSKENEAISNLEALARSIQAMRGTLTDRDVERARGAMPSLAPGGAMSVTNYKKVAEANQRRLDDLQYYILKDFNDNTRNFSPIQKQALMNRVGIDLKDLSPGVIKRLNEDK